jgi:hypothetical protein
MYSKVPEKQTDTKTPETEVNPSYPLIKKQIVPLKSGN